MFSARWGSHRLGVRYQRRQSRVQVGRSAVRRQNGTDIRVGPRSDIRCQAHRRGVLSSEQCRLRQERHVVLRVCVLPGITVGVDVNRRVGGSRDNLDRRQREGGAGKRGQTRIRGIRAARTRTRNRCSDSPVEGKVGSCSVRGTTCVHSSDHRSATESTTRPGDDGRRREGHRIDLEYEVQSIQVDNRGTTATGRNSLRPWLNRVGARRRRRVRNRHGMSLKRLMNIARNG